MKVRDVKHSTTTPLVSKDISTTEETNCSSRSPDANHPDKEKNRAEKEGKRKERKGCTAPATLYRYDESTPRKAREGTKKGDLGQGSKQICNLYSLDENASISSKKQAEIEKGGGVKECGGGGREGKEEKRSRRYVNCTGTTLDRQRPTRNAKQLHFSMVNDHRQ